MRKKNRGLYHFLGTADIPDIRCIGFSKFPVYCIDNGFFDKAVARLGLPPLADEKVKESVSRIDGKIKIDVVPEIDGGSGIVWSEQYDGFTLTPDHSIVSRVNGSNRQVLLDASYSWIDHDGLQLPTLCLSEELHYDEAGKVSFSEYHSFDVHWLSVGEPLDPKLFDPEWRDNLKELMKFIDKERVLTTRAELGERSD
jgi:hypothetical protein